jgi:hypothetical protein
MRRTYRNNGGLHVCNDAQGNERQIKTGQIFEEDDAIIAKVQPPGSPVKFELVDLAGTPTPVKVEVPVANTPEDEDNRVLFEDMTVDELKEYAHKNTIPLGEARLKKDIINVILAAVQEE